MSRWTTPSELKVKLPSLRTIVFVLVMLLSVGAVAVVATIEVQVHPGPTRSAAIDDTKVTAWISAIGGAAGALGTAGALWLGAVTFRRQVMEQRRRQATAVSMSTSPVRDAGQKRVIRLELRNDSDFPIYGVSLVGTNRIGKYKDQNFRHALPAGENMWVDLSPDYGVGGYAMFTDSAGNSWKRYMNGDFEPHGRKPDRWSQPGSKRAANEAARSKQESETPA